jgi:hypothetical protein
MEHHIAHMYELRRFLLSVNVAARETSRCNNPLQTANKPNHCVPEKRRTQLVDPALLDAAARIGVALPPLALARH